MGTATVMKHADEMTEVELSDVLLARLGKDMREAAKLLSRAQLRYVVDLYYQMQQNRIRAGAQAKQAAEAGEPAELLGFFGRNLDRLEGVVRSALDVASGAHREGRWAKSQVGIGPVIAAGLLAHIDIEKAPTAGHIWRFAGLDPTVRWSKGEKRPWNADLKRLCWLMGESFVKTSGHADSFYGRVWRERKTLEEQRNERGDFRDQAEAKLKEFKIGKDTDAFAAYSKGKLPPARIHLRAERYAVKLFLSHYQYVAHVVRYGREPVKPYVISILGHADLIVPPSWPTE